MLELLTQQMADFLDRPWCCCVTCQEEYVWQEGFCDCYEPEIVYAEVGT